MKNDVPKCPILNADNEPLRYRNPEGYSDPTAFFALRNVMKPTSAETKAEGRDKASSPDAGDPLRLKRREIIMNDKNIRLVTAESVRAGHPDKFCDQVADAILDAHLRQDPNARVAVEVFATAGKIIVGGEVTSKADGCRLRQDRGRRNQPHRLHHERSLRRSARIAGTGGLPPRTVPGHLRRRR